VLIKKDQIRAVLVCGEPLTPGEEVVAIFGDDKDYYLLVIDDVWLRERRQATKLQAPSDGETSYQSDDLVSSIRELLAPVETVIRTLPIVRHRILEIQDSSSSAS
jgi:hypothetical protein